LSAQNSRRHNDLGQMANASIAGLFELECFVSDKVSWSDTPTFHNTLVVGSSPTSSTTHSRYRKIRECPPMPGFLPYWRIFRLGGAECCMLRSAAVLVGANRAVALGGAMRARACLGSKNMPLLGAVKSDGSHSCSYPLLR
jgi:hypothetical protein